MALEINHTTLRKVMSEFATGVCVVAFGDPPMGVTVNSFTSVSMDPALVLYCIKTQAGSHENIMNFPRFSINILNHKQKDVATLCVARGGHSLDSSLYEFSELAIPVLKEANAIIECERTATYPGGDHTIVVAKVLSLNIVQTTQPLIFHRSQFLGV